MAGIPEDSISVAPDIFVIAPQRLTNAISISAGINHCLALNEDNTIFAWGWNRAGQATGVSTSNPDYTNGLVRVEGEILRGVKAVSAGVSFNAAINADDALVGWGDSLNDRLKVPKGITKVFAVAVGWDGCYVVGPGGTVIQWGLNVRGEHLPPPGLSNIVTIATTKSPNGNTLALKRDGTVARWGYDTFVPLDLTDVTAISVGTGGNNGSHCLALRKNGTVIGWGLNDHGQATVPTQLTNVIAISAGRHFSAALKNDGEVVVWGEEPSGQTERLRDVIAIAAGPDFLLAITTKAAVAERFRQK